MTDSKSSIIVVGAAEDDVVDGDGSLDACLLSAVGRETVLVVEMECTVVGAFEGIAAAVDMEDDVEVEVDPCVDDDEFGDGDGVDEGTGRDG